MTVSTTTIKNSYTANGVTTVFPFTFRVLDAEHLSVVLTDEENASTTQILNTDYTVPATAIGVNGGGSVTFTTAPTDGYTVTLIRVTPKTQGTDFQNQGAFYPESHEEAFDREMMVSQELGEQVGRSLRGSFLDGPIDEMPPAADRANMYLAFDADGNPVMSAGTGADAGLRADLAASGGSALVGFLQAGTGAVSRTVQSKLRERFHVDDFGAVGDGVTDDTAAILTANTAALALGIGTLEFGPKIYGVSSLEVDWGTAHQTVSWVGSGERLTVIKKIGVTTTPIIDWTADVGTDGIYCRISDMEIRGSAKSSHGIRFTRIARLTMSKVHVNSCDVGLELAGALINQFHDCDFNSNNIGVRTRVSSGVYANLLQFNGGGIRSNTTFGMDIGSANGLSARGLDIEQNGTSDDLSTGQLVIRDTVDDEIGYSNILFTGGWFENGLGSNIKVEAASGLTLTFSDIQMISSEDGRVMDVGAIGAIVLDRVTAGSPSDTVTLAASRSSISNSTINTITDTSTYRIYRNVLTGTGPIISQVSGADGALVGAANYLRSGSADTTVPNNTATTIFAVDGTPPGFYQVMAYILNLGSVDYIATAVVAHDGAIAKLCSADNAANLSITVSGSNVQVTQTSGVSQTVSYKALRVA